jgi:hypothetical protein
MQGCYWLPSYSLKSPKRKNIGLTGIAPVGLLWSIHSTKA